MKVSGLDQLGAYDTVYVSPHARDAAASCFERMTAEAGRGRRVLVVIVFTTEPGATGCDADVLDLGLAAAPLRDPAYRSLRGVLFDRVPADAEAVERAAWAFNEVGHRTRAKRVYLPLAAGGHADHVVAHDAALRVFHGGAGRDVYFYEDRPYALVPGAVRLRLGQVGVQLPPEAVRVARGPGALRLALALPGAPHVREHARGPVERLACGLRAVRAGLEARGWQPQRAFGPRLQPIIHDAAGPSAAPGGADRDALCGASVPTVSWAAAYTHRLGVPAGSERYWLLLPSRADGFISAAAAEIGGLVS
jgi:hypothetical protein